MKLISRGVHRVPNSRNTFFRIPVRLEPAKQIDKDTHHESIYVSRYRQLQWFRSAFLSPTFPFSLPANTFLLFPFDRTLRFRYLRWKFVFYPLLPSPSGFFCSFLLPLYCVLLLLFLFFSFTVNCFLESIMSTGWCLRS